MVPYYGTARLGLGISGEYIPIWEQASRNVHPALTRPAYTIRAGRSDITAYRPRVLPSGQPHMPGRSRKTSGLPGGTTGGAQTFYGPI